MIEPTTGTVSLGSTVNIKDDSSGAVSTYKLVSKHGAKPREGLISDESPLGQALMGHAAGDTVTYTTPNGQQKTVTIQSIE